MELIDIAFVEYGDVEALVDAEDANDAITIEDQLRSKLSRPSQMRATVTEISNGVFTVRVRNGY